MCATFSINAGTYTLKHNSQNNKNIILKGTTNYVIPIYQRPYSWTETQLKKFINDISLKIQKYRPEIFI